MLIFMKNPWVRLAYITVCSVLVLTIIVFVLKIYSESMQHGAYNHPLVQQPYHLVISATTPDLGPIGQLEFYQKAHSKWPGAFLEVPIQISRDGTAVVYPFDDIKESGWGDGDVFEHTFGKLQKLSNGKILTLNELLGAMPDSFLFLKVMDQDPAMFQPAVEVLKNNEKQDNVIVYSQMMDSFNYVFKDHPHWVFAGGTLHLQQLHILDAIFLPGLAKIKPDFFVVNTKNIKDQLLTKSAMNELNRRFKRILFDGSIEEYKALPDWVKSEIKGFVTAQPDYFLEVLQN
ncbi:MAG: hypothetical protein MK008_03525 [Bdellovibrionales bacterium]|nr:hypothetical protein [Bdellovibrionales bacterium]